MRLDSKKNKIAFLSWRGHEVSLSGSLSMEV